MEQVVLRDFHKTLRELTEVFERVLWLKLAMVEASKRHLNREKNYSEWEIVSMALSLRYKEALASQEYLIGKIEAASPETKAEWKRNFGFG